MFHSETTHMEHCCLGTKLQVIFNSVSKKNTSNSNSIRHKAQHSLIFCNPGLETLSQMVFNQITKTSPDYVLLLSLLWNKWIAICYGHLPLEHISLRIFAKSTGVGFGIIILYPQVIILPGGSQMMLSCWNTD